MKGLIYILLFFCSFNLCGQYKYEKESRISSKLIPPSAIEFIESIEFDKKHKWYKEESEQGITYEFKSLRNKNKFSIEFDENGLLLDVEREVKLQNLAYHLQQLLLKNLSTKFERFKIKKIQIQAKGNNHDLRQFILNDSRSAQIIIGYELVVKGRIEDKESLQYELLIHPIHGIISLKEIISRPTDNLEF